MDGVDLKRADYHIHTKYSDGALEPEEIVDRYLADGYDAIAITDHDGIDGAWKALFYAEGKDITVIKGIEISTRSRDGSAIHVLGYGIDFHSEDLIEAINLMRRWRADRNRRMLELLNDIGYAIYAGDLAEINDGRYTGKPVIAEVMVAKGYAADIDDAFHSILNRPALRAIDKKTFLPQEAIDVIHRAGGIAVMAHPMELKGEYEEMSDFIPRLYEALDKMKGWGVDGIECYHPSANDEQSERLRAYAEENGLVITWGSDFHSDSNRRKYEG